VPFLFVSSYFNLEVNYFALIFFSLIIASISFLKDIEDLKGDQKAGFVSIPFIIGEHKAILFSFYSLFVLVCVFGIIFSINNILFLVPMLLSLVLLFFVWFIFEKKKIVKNSKCLNLFMVVVIVIQFLFSLVYII